MCRAKKNFIYNKKKTIHFFGVIINVKLKKYLGMLILLLARIEFEKNFNWNNFLIYIFLYFS